MSWEQVHIFFDIISAIGAAAYVLIGLMLNSKLVGVEMRLRSDMEKINLRIEKHDAACDTDRKSLDRRIDRLGG